MSERRTIGQILTSVGRITEADVATALEYQRDNGGYFGEALLACGLVTADELEWGLASQFDLPYVFPEADAVDPEAASLVTPEWALAHMALPIMRTERSLTVVVDSPMKAEPIDELRERTELEVELALASPATIRDLIRQVYARASASESEERAPLELSAGLDAVLQSESPRFGVSVRGVRAHFWWDDRGTVRRRPLAGDWRADLERHVTPGPATMTRGKLRTEWEGDLSRAGAVVGVEAMYIADESGHELLFRPRERGASLEERFPPPPAGVVSEIRLLARSGTARFIVTTDPAELGHEIVPHLPAILLDPSWRSIYISDRHRPGAEEVFSLQMPSEADRWEAELEALRAFHFDVVTVDLSGSERSWTGRALDVASVAFLLWSDEDVAAARDAGIRWRIRISKHGTEGLEWALEPVNA